MAILVDRPVWRWRGRRWAHMISDVTYDELHDFAQGIGKFRLAFQGDHYDVDEPTRQRAIEAGALAVDSRVLLRRLKGSGLRHRDPWRLVDRGPVDADRLADRLGGHALPPRLVSAACRAGAALGGRLDLTVLERTTEIGVGLRGAAGRPLPELGRLTVAEVHVWDCSHPLVELIEVR